MALNVGARRSTIQGRRWGCFLRSESTQALVRVQPEIERALASRSDFRNYAHDVSEAVLFSLARRHLEYLNLRQVPRPREVPALSPGDLFFLKLTQIGHGPSVERSLDLLNLQNVFGTYRNGSHSMVAALGSEGTRVNLYLGARRVNLLGEASSTAYDFVQNLRRSVEGNLPGSRFQSYSAGRDSVVCPAADVFENITRPLAEFPYLAAITGIPSLRGDRQEQFAQSLDRFVQALQGHPYLLLIIAEPLSEGVVSEVISDCLRLSSEVHSWVKVGISQSEATGESHA